MDYVVGSVADLVTGNVTPNRPKVLKRALTPTKHQPSPNVTPKSEFVDDRSIFLSPTLQKKKAMAKKSPKRIFQNPDFDITNEGDGTSEKADKVKKHLKEELDCDKTVTTSPWEQKNAIGVQNEPSEGKSPKKKAKKLHKHESVLESPQMSNENTPKKKKKQNNSVSIFSETVKEDQEIHFMASENKMKVESEGTPKKLKKQSNFTLNTMEHENKEKFTFKTDTIVNNSVQTTPKKRKKKINLISNSPKIAGDHDKNTMNTDIKTKSESEGTQKKKKKQKNSILEKMEHENKENVSLKTESVTDSVQSTPKKKKKKINLISNSPKIARDQDKNTMNTDIKTKSESEGTLKKKKKQKNSILEKIEHENKENVSLKTESVTDSVQSTPKKKKKKNRKRNKKGTSSQQTADVTQNTPKSSDEQDGPHILNRKRKLSDTINQGLNKIKMVKEKPALANEMTNKESKSKKKKSKQIHNTETDQSMEIQNQELTGDFKPKQKKCNKSIVNPNAITNEDTDSEHESDHEINSENEGFNNEILDQEGSFEESSDDEDEKKEESKTLKKKGGAKKTERTEINLKEELERTLFVGNVVFTPKCKKEMKKIFMHYGPIETIRLRTIPIKDARVTPKLAVIKNELHPERSTVNVYIKYKNAESAEKALAENNTLYRDTHLRVTGSQSTGDTHDLRASVFVGNLPFALEDDGLREKFEKCGEIESVRIIRDKQTNIGKGFGYVNFTSKDAVELALALTDEDLTIKNRILRVKRCTHSNKSPDNTSNNQSMNQRDFNGRGRSFNNRGGRGGQRGFNDRGGRRDFNNRGSLRGHRGGRGGQNFSSRGGQRSYNNRGQDGQSQGFQGRNDKNDIGAFRRIMNKRQHEDGGNDGPAQKRPRNINQPGKEKKPRKEFVGMTAEKKKKRKNGKSQGIRQKKALSEILSK